MSKFPENFRAFSATFQPVSFTGSSILGKLKREHSVNSALRFYIPMIVVRQGPRYTRKFTTMPDQAMSAQGRILIREPIFVNRRDEIEKVVNLSRADDSSPKTIINFYGVPGIGKTSLLHQIRKELSDEVDSLFVDFAPLAEHREEPLAQRKAHVLHTLVTSTSPQFFPEDLRPKLEQLTHARTKPSDDEDDELDRLVVQAITSRQKSVVLFFDTCEQVSDAIFAWLERRILLPLIEENHANHPTVAVLASRNVLRWRHYAVRRKVDPIELKPLDEQATHAQVFPPEPHNDEQQAQASRIYQMTFGHPSSTEYVVTKSETPLDFNEQEAPLRRSIVDELLKRAYVPDDIRRVVETIALFRDFDIHTLRDVLPHCLPKTYKDKTQADYYNLLKQLLETHLIAWNNDRHAYVMDSTIGRIIEFGLRVYDARYYDAVNTAACNYYSRLVTIARTDERRVEFFQGYLFHLIQFVAMPDLPASSTETNPPHTETDPPHRKVQERLSANFKDIPNETRKAWWQDFSEVPTQLPEQPHTPLNSNRLSIPRSEQTEASAASSSVWEDVCTIIATELRAFFDPQFNQE